MLRHPLDPVVTAAALALDLVCIHPFVDGNGRIQRHLVHHVLACRGFNLPGVVLPLSATIPDRIDLYGVILDGHSQGLLSLIEWEPTKHGKVGTLNDTTHFYRFFDAPFLRNPCSNTCAERMRAIYP